MRTLEGKVAVRNARRPCAFLGLFRPAGVNPHGRAASSV